MVIMKNGVGRRVYVPAETFVLKVLEYLDDPNNPNEMLVKGIRGDTGSKVVVGLNPPGPRDAQRKNIFEFNRPGKFQVMPGGLMRIDRTNLVGNIYRAHYVKMLRRHDQDNEMFQQTVQAKPMIFYGDKLVGGVKVPAVNAAVYTMQHEAAATATTVEELESQIIHLSQQQYAEKMTRHGGVNPIVHVRESGTPYIETFNIGYEIEDPQTQQYRPPTETEIRNRLYTGRVGERWNDLISNADNGVFAGSLDVVAGCKILVGKDTAESRGFQAIAAHYLLDQKSKVYKEYAAFCRMCNAEPADTKNCYRWSIVGMHVRPHEDGFKVFASSLQPMNQHPKTINGTRLDPKMMGITEIDETANQMHDMAASGQQRFAQANGGGHAPRGSEAVRPRQDMEGTGPQQPAQGYSGAGQFTQGHPQEPSANRGIPPRSNVSSTGFHADPIPSNHPHQASVTQTTTAEQSAPLGETPVVQIPAALGAQLEQMTRGSNLPSDNESLEKLAEECEQLSQSREPSFS